tara:strand:- start:170 stop:328 length:159 start_codon:yes stop_codon:yes gene_type:complete
MSIEEINEITGIDIFFLSKITHIIDAKKALKSSGNDLLTKKNIPLFLKAKIQ